MTYCAGCGRPDDEGDHTACERRQRETDPPRYCAVCGRKLVVQVLPLSWRAKCVKCGPLPNPRRLFSLDAETASAPGEYIRRQRELRDLSMRQFAEMVGISNPYLSQIKRGVRAPSESVLNAIAASLRTSTDALRADAGVPRKSDDESAVVDAIRADEWLTAAEKRALLEVYKAFHHVAPCAEGGHVRQRIESTGAGPVLSRSGLGRARRRHRLGNQRSGRRGV